MSGNDPGLQIDADETVAEFLLPTGLYRVHHFCQSLSRHGIAGVMVSRDYRGQGEAKAGAAGRVRNCAQAATVRFNNGTANGKAHAGSMHLVGKERKF
jgi:hypothetical protein